MKFCNQCGKKINIKAKFCESCGANLTNEDKLVNINVPDNLNANVKVAVTNETTEKVLKGVSSSIYSVSDSATSKIQWLKGFIKPALILSILGIVIIGAIGGSGYYYSEHYLGAQSELAGVKLSHTKADVRLLKGIPNKEDEEHWLYMSESSQELLAIHFNEEKVKKVTSSVGYFQNNPTLNKIVTLLDFRLHNYNYDTYDQLISRLGKPSSIENKDSSTRTLFYDKYNTSFTLKDNRVYFVGIYNKEI